MLWQIDEVIILRLEIGRLHRHLAPFTDRTAFYSLNYTFIAKQIKDISRSTLKIVSLKSKLLEYCICSSMQKTERRYLKGEGGSVFIRKSNSINMV